MNYELKAETAHIRLSTADDPQARIAACEKEIAAALEKHGCILIVQVAAKDETK